MTNKVIIYYIHRWNHESHHVYFGWWFSLWELWGYWLVHIAVPPMGLQTTSAPWVLFLAPPLGRCAQSNGWLRASTSLFVKHKQSLSRDIHTERQRETQREREAERERRREREHNYKYRAYEIPWFRWSVDELMTWENRYSSLLPSLETWISSLECT